MLASGRRRPHGRDARPRSTTTASSVTVGFTDGDTRGYDLVVGADGLRSQVREHGLRAGVQPNYTGQVCWRYNLPRIEGLDHIWVYIGATGTAGFVPLGPDLMYMLMIEKPPAGEPLRLRWRAWPPRCASAWRSSAARSPSTST